MSLSEGIKGQSDISAREGSKSHSFDAADAQDGDAEVNYHDHLGSTRQDHFEMDRMGKTQELRVSDEMMNVQFKD